MRRTPFFVLTFFFLSERMGSVVSEPFFTTHIVSGFPFLSYEATSEVHILLLLSML